jgi:hypothetical protein
VSNYRVIECEAGCLIPPSVDEWLPGRHPVRFGMDVIATPVPRLLTGSHRFSGASY